MVGAETADLIAAAADPGIERPAATIAAASFARLCAADISGLPDPRFVTLRDGLPLAVRTYPATGEDLLVLVHGAGGHGAHLHTLARRIAARGLATVAVPDMRGNGLSGARRSDAVDDPLQLRDDLAELIAALRPPPRRGRAFVAGHSAGAGVVLRLAGSEHGGEIAGVLLLAPLLAAAAPTTRPALGGWVSLYRNRVRALVALNRRDVRWLNGLTVMEFNQPPATRSGCETLAWSFETMRAYGPGDWKRELAAAASSRPCTVLIGARDECFVPEAYPAAVSEAAPQARLHIVPDCGHWDLLTHAAAAEALAATLSRR